MRVFAAVLHDQVCQMLLLDPKVGFQLFCISAQADIMVWCAEFENVMKSATKKSYQIWFSPNTVYTFGDFSNTHKVKKERMDASVLLAISRYLISSLQSFYNGLGSKHVLFFCRN